ncbi:MAG: diadenylate cyclase CdaA [Eubacterium sp.]|nr:diadenylate cyclase CdaA [Eubacterium sp.]
MLAFRDKYMFWLNIPSVTVIDIVEIIIITFLMYSILIWIKNTRAWVLFKGILVIVVFVLIAALFQMNTILWLAGKLLNVGIIALAVIFQPELRKALDQLGRKKFFLGMFSWDPNRVVHRFSEKTVNELVKATFEMAKVKTGALIVIEKDIMLSEYERTGITLDSLVSSQLLINIFEKNTPLHDGAIIVRGDRVVSATCYLPLSDNMELDKELGTRHRAAVGISEVSDSLTIIVSEETGAVSSALGGVITRGLDGDELKRQLMELSDAGYGESRWQKWRRRIGHAQTNVESHNE